jgi:hypothetical protein
MMTTARSTAVAQFKQSEAMPLAYTEQNLGQSVSDPL